MDIKPLVQFQLNGSYRLIADLANRTSDEEWRSRAHPNANLIGFTVWHCARIIDWAVNPVMRGEPELADQPDWSDVAVEGALFGAGVTREVADSVPFLVTRARLAAYVSTMREDAIQWLAAAGPEDLEGVTDLKTGAKPGYVDGECWSEIEDLHGIPKWQFLIRPSVSHIRVHYGEVSGQLEAMRSGVTAAG